MNETRTYIEDKIIARKVCTIKFRAENGAVATIQSRIREISGTEGKEFLKTGSLDIPLDHIIQVDGLNMEPPLA